MNWDISLNKEVDLLRKTVRKFAENENVSIVDEIDRCNDLPSALWEKMGKIGLLGVTVPETFGGSGMSYLAHLVAMEEILGASISEGLSFGAYSNLCVNQIWINVNENQKKKFLPGLSSGSSVGTFAMSESGAGSNVAGSMTCSVVKSGDHRVTNGTKM